uniref:Uncharacterized protein n=1 Tax=Siphoviridae sp. ctxMM9 TaxID=2827973 RepID=A0A8S5T7V8_9CAUD|nr:MAG TPA: hypothetical protein [Siphoviridae sp. ctxMM9]
MLKSGLNKNLIKYALKMKLMLSASDIQKQFLKNLSI